MPEFPTEIRTTKDLERLKTALKDSVPSPHLFRILLEIAEPTEESLAAELNELFTDLVRKYTTKLTPQYHAVPWSEAIIEIEDFKEIYEKTLSMVGNFHELTSQQIAEILLAYPASLMVFRLIVGYTWNELSDIILIKTEAAVSPQKLQQIERSPSVDDIPGRFNTDVFKSIAEVIYGIAEGSVMSLPEDLDPENFRSRQHKVDTLEGWESVNRCASGEVGYSDLLYERYTGRPFAYVRDALSEKKGDILEDALEALFRDAGIPYDRIDDNQAPGFEQAPDYLLPNRNAPRIAIEAKLAEDGGTARDKASRIERLKRPCEERGIVLMALVDGKGFRRFNDVLLPTVRNTKGHTYTLETMEELLQVDELISLCTED